MTPGAESAWSRSGITGSASLVQNSDADTFQLVTCQLEHEEFAVDIRRVQEINRMADITRVPKSPPFLEGVMNLRGRIIPALDLRRRFGLPDAPRTARSRIIVVHAHSRMMGLIVDAVTEVLRIPRHAIEPPPSLGGAIGAEFIQGVGQINGRLLTVLDLDRVLESANSTTLADSPAGGRADFPVGGRADPSARLPSLDAGAYTVSASRPR
ncbi:chemotaxis protein CheW [Nitrospira sp. Kam-Ns4a]